VIGQYGASSTEFAFYTFDTEKKAELGIRDSEKATLSCEGPAEIDVSDLVLAGFRAGQAASQVRVPLTKSEKQAGDAQYQALLDAARVHGDNSEGDHEIGDLQMFLQLTWAQLTPDQRAKVMANSEVKATIEQYQDEEGVEP
jgi:hypothetical protein